MKEFWKKGMAGEQRGAFIVFTALAVWFLMMFVAFAVDFGNYYQHRSRLQNAADAAAPHRDPSTVLLGLTCGLSLCFPNLLPPNSAKASQLQVPRAATAKTYSHLSVVSIL